MRTSRERLPEQHSLYKAGTMPPLCKEGRRASYMDTHQYRDIATHVYLPPPHTHTHARAHICACISLWFLQRNRKNLETKERS